ncbi:glycosyltransferase family 2 protein [Methylobacterium sp. E-005]|uniref:glycosyltransferase family 2 protein n=1 Tax=Methylobacterium sp. E-005 TaxID=2836549 RepID=UPI001FBBDCBF|nr:glycosyltransferase family 2 protein [Methylobacterium sp. E-005]MCJ2087475.1 glycosyltransferase family 2 protein [Methylobacterium sp. E-005]
MNILILAAGESARTEDDPYPIWLSEVDGQLMLERQINAFAPLDPNRYIVCTRAVDNARHHIRDIVRLISPKADIIEIKRPTAGAACTALLAIDHIKVDEELIILNATDQINVDFVEVVEQFRSSAADGGVLTFESLHPRYSFVRVDEEGRVVEVAEKRPISRQANAGFYWLRRAGDFFDALQTMMLKDAHVNGLFYVAPALNELILRQKAIRTFGLSRDAYMPIKSPRQLSNYEHLTEGGPVL